MLTHPEYTANYHELKSIFDPGMNEIIIPGSEIRIANLRFVSEFGEEGFSSRNDISIKENMSFSYPVFIPPDRKSNKVILLLHGLNERSWVKYLVWAYWLSMKTGSYIVLFPISFHINRSPQIWLEPRAMMQYVKERKDSFAGVEMASFANIALSRRLTSDPMRFFTSGYQTSSDIIKLLLQIKAGKHEIIPEKSRVDLFAYSIGAFLAQILMIGNPENIFTDSRLFMLCGGSVFSSMRGTSKHIMDSHAFNRVYGFYLNDFENEVRKESHIFNFLRSSQLGMAFRAMLDFNTFRQFRESIFSRLKEQIRSIALLKDTVIPASGIVGTLNGVARNAKNAVEIWDFPFPYTHEYPFPVLDNSRKNDVDSGFDRLISEASLFLA